MYVCKSSRKIVIEARTEASSRRAFIGYIFLSTNNHPHLETNDFTLLLFLLLFLFLFLLIPHLFVSIFDVKTLLFSALKRLISNPQTLKSILPHEYTPRRRNRDRVGMGRVRKWGNIEISLFLALHAPIFFYRFVENGFFPFQRHPNDDKRKKKKKIIVRSR